MTTRPPIACVHVPELPIVAHHKPPAVEDAQPERDADAPHAVHRGRGTAARILWCDRRASAAGVAPGRTLAAAKARAADLRSIELDPHLLAEATRAVIHRLLAVSPRISASGPTRFWLEPVEAGDASLARWCASARRELSGLGPVSIGVGPTATVAWAAARSAGPGDRLVDAGDAQAFLDAAPAEILDIDSESLDILAALGIRSVGQLRALDPLSVGMRFGASVADARRRAEGLDPRGPTTPRAETAFEVHVDLTDDIEELEPLLFLLRPAADRLGRDLGAREVGALGLELALALRGSVEHVVRSSAASPVADGRALFELLRARLDGARISSAVTAIDLRATRVSALRTRPADLFSGSGPDPGAREVALERLRGRLGAAAVTRASRVEVGPPLDRACWEQTPRAPDEPGGQALPWRRIEPPALVRSNQAVVAGRRRRLVRIGRVERVTAPWWEDGQRHVELLAWAELDGPVLALLRARCDTGCEDEWEVVAWVD